jgi:hypothetical protein
MITHAAVEIIVGPGKKDSGKFGIDRVEWKGLPFRYTGI